MNRNSVRTREDQYREGLISNEERVSWLKINHPNLTIGDWEDLSRITQLEEHVDILEAKKDATNQVKQLKKELVDMEDGYEAKCDELEFDKEAMRARVLELEKMQESDRSLAYSAKQRSVNQANTISELMATNHSQAARIFGPVEGDWVVIHTSLNYSPDVTIIGKDEFDTYFNEDNGWEDIDIEALRALKSGRVLRTDGNAISVVRV